MRTSIAFVCMLLVLAACVPPTSVPVTVTPQTPTVTDGPRPPTSTPRVSPIEPPTATPAPSPLETPVPSLVKAAAPHASGTVYTVTLVNPGFEAPFIHPLPIPEFTVAQGWLPVRDDLPPCNPGYLRPCIPGTVSSPIEWCPKNCQTLNGNCKDDYGCFWMRPEFKQQGKQNVFGLRVYEGQSAQTIFTFGRLGRHGLVQEVHGVNPGDIVTFTIMVQAWQCFDFEDCKLGHMNPERRAELMAAWGCTDFNVCRTWPASDIAGYLRADLPRAYTQTHEITPTMGLRIGIDPTGQFDHGDGAPDWSGITWGEVKEAWDIWTQLVVTATARSNHVTLVAQAFPRSTFAYSNYDVQWDQAQVTARVSGARVYLPIIVK